MLNYRKFQIKYGSIEREFLVPKYAYLTFCELRESFNSNFPEPEPSTPAELLAKFLGYIASLVDPNQSNGKYDYILKYALTEFQDTYLLNMDINAFAFILLRDNPSLLLKFTDVQANLISNYYLAVTNANNELVVDDNLPNLGASNSKYAVCFGQGNINYFELLSHLSTVYWSFCGTDLLVPVCEHLKLAAGSEEFSCLYPHGFDFVSWINKSEQTPDEVYLLSAPVSCPLIAVTQLVYYCLSCKLEGLTPGKLADGLLAGTTGHGQGILTSLVISVSDSWESFFQNALKAVQVMLSIGTRTGLKLASSEMLNPWIDTDEGRITPMMMISGLPLHEVEDLVTQTNNDILKDRHVAISVINGPESLFVSGAPESIYALVSNLRSHEVHNLLEQLSFEGLEKIFEVQSGLPPILSKFAYKEVGKAFYRFLNIYAPFHSHFLKDTYDLIVQDLDKLGIEFSSKDLRVPVYDTHNGANLQEYDNIPQEYPLTSRLVKLVTELPVHWELATKFTSADVIKIGQVNVFGLLE